VRTGVLAIPSRLAARVPDPLSHEVFAAATDLVHEVLTNLSETGAREVAQQREAEA